jgi:RHS repeat-associated protein
MTGSTYGSGSIIDTLGQDIVTSTVSYGLSGDSYAYNDANRNPQKVQVNYTQITNVTAFGDSIIQDEVPNNVPMPTSVVYPDGETIKIAYEQNSLSALPPWAASHQYSCVPLNQTNNLLGLVDSNGNLEGVKTCGTSGTSRPVWNTTVGGQTTDGTVVWQNYGRTWTSGRIASITYPQGGSVTYAYSGIVVAGQGQFNGQYNFATWPAQVTRTVNDNNGHSATWTYQISAPSSNNGILTVTETDPANNTTVLYFAGATQIGNGIPSWCTNGYSTGCNYSYIQAAKLSYNGAALSQNLIAKEVTCYNLQNTSESGCITPTVPISFPIKYTDVYTHPTGLNGAIGLPNDVETQMDPFGNITYTSVYGFGATFRPSGSPLSTTASLYDGENASCGTLTIAAMHDRPCSVSITGPSGLASQVKYTYNGAGHSTQTSKLVSGSTNLTSTASYNPNGTVASVIDANGATTNYYYNGAGGCNNLLLTSTVFPVNSLSTTQTWDCNGGVVTSASDQNGQVTTYGFVDQTGVADPNWRLRSTKDPFGYITWNTYSTAATPFTQESSLLFNGGASAVDGLTTVDGLGRPVYVQKRQGPSPGTTIFDSVQYTYGWNSTGQVSTQSVPYSAAASAAPPPGTAVTTTQTDALGRTASVADGGGGTVSYQYVSNDVLQTSGPAPTGENTKQRQLEYDGLGRLTSVCEITSASGSGAGPCGQSNPQTGLLTKYTYDALGNLLTVTQNAQPGAIGGTQTRAYGPYDGLSRLTSETNPESGTTTYTYDNDATCGTSKGDPVKSFDANGNTVCNTYDALHRTTSTTFSGPNATTNRYFIYDAATVNGQAMANAKGRLAEGYTAASSSGTKVTDEGFSYTARGELANFYESTPHSAGYYSVPMTYWANGLLESFGPFLTEDQMGFIPDGEGRAYSLYDFPHQDTAVLGSVTYSPAGQPTQLMTDCNGGGVPCTPITYTYYPNTLRMKQYSTVLSTGTISDGTLSGSLNWNPNGSLQQLTIADPFNSADAQTCTYSADDLGRIASTSCGSTWAQTFSYDVFGNVTKNGSISWIPGYNASTNHYSLGGTSYDANGNVLNDTFSTYTWDAQGKNLSTAYSVGGETWAFTYDAFGHMIELSVNGGYVYSYINIGKFRLSATGQTAAYSEFPLPGGSVYSQNGGATGIQLADWLGTIRAFYSLSGGYSRSGAHAPFGEAYGYQGGYPTGFAGQGGMGWGEGDDGSMNNTTYYFPERQYRSSQGRWLSPDPAGLVAANPSNPQSWNRYAYALNNPLRYKDPLGLYCFYGGAGDTPSNDGDPTDFNFNEVGAQGQADCLNENDRWYQDQTSETVNGDTGDVESFENGQQIYPQIVQPLQSYANCVKNAGNYFSLQHGLQAASGGSLGNSWLSGALLGNPFSDGIAAVQGVFNGSASEAGSSGSSAALGFYDPAGRTLEAATQLQDVTVVTSSVTATSVTLPGASMTSVSLNATSQTIPLSTLGAIAKPFTAVAKGLNVWNYGVTSFSGFVCGIGR